MEDPDREQDKEFEAFLGQFQLRRARPLTESPAEQASAGHGKSWWILAAAAVIVAAFLSTFLVRNSIQPRGPVATIEVAGDSSYTMGQTITGVPIRAGRGESMALVLEDGSQVEMRAESELLIESAGDGVRIRLDKGAVLVTAAKQAAGHLHVKTGDALVSVVGTVFVVEARPSGTRVGVLHGELEVRQRETLRKVLPGEQASTNPSFEEQSLAEMIAWSRSAARLAELLPQPSIAAPPVEAPVATEPAGRAIPAASQRGGEQEPPSQSQPPQPSPAPEQPQQSDAGADGPGKDILLRACSACHAVDIVTAKRFATRGAYADRVAKDRQMGAGLSDAEASTLVDYLFKTYRLTP